jgi:hypothetical protein
MSPVNLSALKKLLPRTGSARDPRTIARLALGLLLVLNLAAAVAVIRPIGGSPEELEMRRSGLQRQLQQKRLDVDRARTLVAKVEKARGEGNEFIDRYFLIDRSESSSIMDEIDRSAKTAGVKVGGHTFSSEPVEGSETLNMLTVTAVYEGTYGDLIELVNLLDRSQRFLILETLTASPQPSGGILNINMKLNTFVRQEAITQ